MNDELTEKVLAQVKAAGSDLLDPNVFYGDMVLPSVLTGRMFAGKTAGELRELGAKIEEKVPDCALVKVTGGFEWLSIEFTFPPKDEIFEDGHKAREQDEDMCTNPWNGEEHERWKRGWLACHY